MSAPDNKKANWAPSNEVVESSAFGRECLINKTLGAAPFALAVR